MTIYQYIILNILSTKLSTKSLLTLYKLSTKMVWIWYLSCIYVPSDACSGYGWKVVNRKRN